MHWKRWRLNGDPLAKAPRRAIIVNEDDPDACWGWQGSTGKGGYARFKVGDHTLAAHRLAYEYFIGPIPEGFTNLADAEQAAIRLRNDLFTHNDLDRIAA
jgi:hypothetical protein